MPHYMMDCYSRDAGKPDGVRCDERAVKATGDTSAIDEALVIAKMYGTQYFRLRKVSHRADVVIYDSREHPHA